MIYGIPTLMEYPGLDGLAAFCAEQGFAFAELNMTFPWFQSGTLSARQLREAKDKYGVGFTVHLHDQVNPFEFSPEMRKGSLENIRFAMELARELGMPRLTMHLQSGTYSSVNGKKTYLYEQCLDRYLELVRSFRDFAEEHLAGCGAVFCIENTSGFQPFQTEAIGLLLESDVFGLTFDIGHSFKAGGQDGRFMLEHEDRIRHFHIHDCSMKSNHLAFGAGGLDLVSYLRLAEKNGCSVVAEVKESGALIRSREYLIDHGLWESAEK